MVAAGNNNANACTSEPAASRYAITVGASDRRDSRLLLPSGGGSAFGPCVDIYAPGANVPGASSEGDNRGVLRSGTSQAAGLAAGAAALHLQAYPEATPGQVRQALMSASVPDAINAAAADGPACAPLLQTRGLAQPPHLSTAPAGVQLAATVLQPRLAFSFDVTLARAAAAAVELRITDSRTGAGRMFDGTSAVLAAGQSVKRVEIAPDPALLFSTPSSAPFELTVEARSADSSVHGRRVPVLVRTAACNPCSLH